MIRISRKNVSLLGIHADSSVSRIAIAWRLIYTCLRIFSPFYAKVSRMFLF